MIFLERKVAAARIGRSSWSERPWPCGEFFSSYFAAAATTNGFSPVYWATSRKIGTF